MAIILDKIFPIDLNKRKAIGFNFPINASNVFNQTYIYKDQIKANLINYLLSNRGERLFKPYFGSNLRSLLFEAIQNKTTDLLNDTIRTDIYKYFPNVIINELTFKNNYDYNSIEMFLDYSINGYGINDNITINLK